jgi:hypothetical protein
VLCKNGVWGLQGTCFLQDPRRVGYLSSSTGWPWFWLEDWRCSAFMWQVDREPGWICSQWRSVSIQRLLPDSYKFWQGMQGILSMLPYICSTVKLDWILIFFSVKNILVMFLAGTGWLEWCLAVSGTVSISQGCSELWRLSPVQEVQENHLPVC